MSVNWHKSICEKWHKLYYCKIKHVKGHKSLKYKK